MQDGQNGILVPGNDSNALGEVLRRYIGQPDLRKRLESGCAGVKTIADQAEEIESIYQKCLDGKRGI